MKNTATIHETTRASPTIQKMLPAYSPAVERAMPTGRKPTAVTSVPVSMGNAVESQAKAAARMRLQPCSILTTIISTAMIASSTSRPSAMMREPSVMRSRLSPATFMTTKTTASTSGTDVATTRPERHPRKTKLTTSTMASASTNERRNSPTDSSTTRGWSVIWSISTPVGTCALASAIASLSFLPSSRTLAPLVMATTTPTASLPLWRTMLSGGSS